MIAADHFIPIVKTYYNFLITEFSFSFMKEQINGNAFYDMQYQDKLRRVSVSYENIEAYFQVRVSILQDGEMPDYDDKTKSFNLSHLNQSIQSGITKIEIALNNEYFAVFKAQDEFEKKLLKAAKELRLFLIYSKMS